MNVSRCCFLLLLLVAAAPLPRLRGQRLDYPTAALSTVWTNGPDVLHTISYPEGSLVKSLLLRSPAQRYGPSFACGFYCRSAAGAPCRDFLLAVFLVYTNSGAGITFTTFGVPQVVWSANRDRPVGENATLRLAPDGDLALRDADGSLVWSTGTAGRHVASVTVTDAGNLALLDKEGAVVWQSFDHPTDVLLPGQRLLAGRSLASNASRWDSREGRYYVTPSSWTTLNAYVKAGPRQTTYYYYGSPENKVGTGDYLRFTNGSLSFFQASSTTPTTSIDLPATAAAQYMRLEFDGHLRVYQWSDSRGWSAAADVMGLYPPPGTCSYPTACGSYGICSGNGQCSCPRDAGDRTASYFLPVKDRRPELGCEAVTPVASCRDARKQRMLRLEDVAVSYGDARYRVAGLKSARTCEEACMRRCSCMAAFYVYGSEESGGSCYLLPQVLSSMDIDPEVMHYNSTGFIKVQLR